MSAAIHNRPEKLKADPLIPLPGRRARRIGQKDLGGAEYQR
jgi:hypothetical protein